MAWSLGSVTIGDPLIDAPCETANESPLRLMGHTEAGTRCEFALYDVDVYGDLVVPGRGDSPLGKLFERRQIVRITPQRVPGVRFTVQCPDFKPGDRFGSETFAPPIQDCAYPLRFWADNNLFAPALGVDVAQMRAPAGEGVEQWYVQTFPAEAIEGYGPFITRWTIHTPDGRLIEADSTGVDRPARRDLDSWFMKSQFDIKAPRIRALIPATDIDPKASRFAVLVLDLATERQISTVRAGSRDPRVPGPPRQ